MVSATCLWATTYAAVFSGFAIAINLVFAVSRPKTHISANFAGGILAFLRVVVLRALQNPADCGTHSSHCGTDSSHCGTDNRTYNRTHSGTHRRGISMDQQYELKDPDDSSGNGKTVSCTLDFSNGQIWVRLDGYGDYTSRPGAGVPIGIEYYQGKVWITVWGDINQDYPTERLCLDGALESNRNDIV